MMNLSEKWKICMSHMFPRLQVKSNEMLFLIERKSFFKGTFIGKINYISIIKTLCCLPGYTLLKHEIFGS